MSDSKSMGPTTTTSQADDYVFLLGRPPISELIAFIRTMAVDGHSVDQIRLTQEWRESNQRLIEIEQLEAGLADNPPILAPPIEMQSFSQRVLADPIFSESYGSVPTELVLVELDRLVVHQKFINLGFVESLKATIPAVPTASDLARVAFGLDQEQPKITVRQAGQGIFQFISPSNDLRALENGLVHPSQVLGFKTTGRPHAYLVMAVGLGSNYLNALHIEGRLVLHNGSHRAYALRSLGVTHVPCVVQHVSLRDELELVASGDLLQNPDRYLKISRPAMLKDYFDEKLTKIFPVPRKSRLVQAQVGAGLSDVPTA